MGASLKRAQKKDSGSEIQNPDFGEKKIYRYRPKLIKNVCTVFGCSLDFIKHPGRSFYAKQRCCSRLLGGLLITEIMLRRRDEPCLEVRKAKISRISNQDIFMSFWTYKNSFRIRRFQPETSKNQCFLVDPN